MTGKDLVDGQFGISRLQLQFLLEHFQEGADLVGGKLQASILSTADLHGLAVLGPWCVVIVAMGHCFWRPQALEQ